MANEPSKRRRRRFDEDGEYIVREMFRDEDLRLTPEEYVSRYGENWYCFSFHEYRYANVELGNWVRRVAELLMSKCSEPSHDHQPAASTDQRQYAA